MVAVVPTLARDAKETALLIASLSILAKQVSPLVIADGGSGPDFIGYLEKSAFRWQRLERSSATLVKQIKAALSAAEGSTEGQLLYTEPDKLWFFQRGLARFLTFAQSHPEAGVIIPSRKDSSFATFPTTQQATEKFVNALCTRELGISGDFLYGPFVLHRQLLPYVAAIPDDLGWGWRLYLMVVARRLKLSIVIVDEHLPCPEEQRKEDEDKSRIYRIEQCAQNLRALALGLKLKPIADSPRQALSERPQ